MTRPWERPSECDEWKVTTSCKGRTLFRRREQWVATARGFRDGELWVRYSDGGCLGGEIGHGSSRAEAEADMRRIICAAIKRYEEWLGVRRFESQKFTAEEICPC